MVPEMNKRGRSFFIKSQQISNLSGTVLVLFTTVRDRVQFRLWKHTFLFLETWNTTCFCWIREHPPLLKDLLWFPCVLFALSVSLTADGFVILFPSRFLCYITEKKNRIHKENCTISVPAILFHQESEGERSWKREWSYHQNWNKVNLLHLW